MCLPVFFNTDPDIDDTVIITAVIFAPELDLQLITTVAGNVSVEKTIRNTLQLLHFWNAEIPLAQGTVVPLVRTPRNTASVYGGSEVAGYDFIEHNRQPLGIPASLVICNALMHAPELVTLVAIGPLTNIVLLLSQYPEYKPYTRRLMTMDGSVGRGNCTPNAEFSIAADPEVAACALRNSIEIAMCGLDVTNQAILTPGYLVTSPELNRTGKMLHALFSHYRSGSIQSGLRMHDLCTITWLVRPELFTLEPCFVVVEAQDEFTSGTTVVDIDGCLGKPISIQVVLDLNVRGFRQ